MQFTRSSKIDTSMWPILYVLIMAVLVTIFGFDLGMNFVTQNHHSGYFIIAEKESDIIIGSFILGLCFGLFISGYVTNGSGRKLTALSSAGIGSLAIMASNIAPNFTVLLTSNFVIGFSFGLFIVPANLYISEITLPKYRSICLLLIPFFASLGCVLSLLTLNNASNTTALAIYLILFIINMILLTLAIIKLPESPRFLALTGSTDAALAVLFKLRHDMGMAARELAQINECCRGETRGIELFLQSNEHRRILALSCTSAILFNISGAVIIPYVAIDILSVHLICNFDNGCYYDYNTSIVCFTFICMLLTVFYHYFFSKYLSFKKVIILSTTIGAGALFVTALGGLLPDSFIQRTLLSLGLICFSFFFYGAWVTHMNVITPVLLPTRGREFGLALIYFFNGIGMLFEMQFYMPIVHHFSFSGYFAIAGLLAIILTYILYLYIPNVENQSLEDIESMIVNYPHSKK